MNEIALSVEKLTKSFRSHWTFKPTVAVSDASFTVHAGEAFGFLGHNGAGKTTTMKCILNLISKNNGTIKVFGKDVNQALETGLIGFLPEQPYYYDHLTVYETLDFFAQLHSINSSDKKSIIFKTLDRLGIADRAKNPVRTLSKGLQQRLGYAQAIINEPKLLLLDEPFSGLDPLGRVEMRKLILDLQRSGTTIFMSSHILSDVEHICNRVSIMNKGQIKTVLQLSDIPKLYGETYEIKVHGSPENYPLLKNISTSSLNYSTESIRNSIQTTFSFNDYPSAANALTQILSETSNQLISFERRSLSLEEIFIKVTTSN